MRALNLELARLPEVVSNPTIGSLRMQYWRDAISNSVAGKPSREPISILLDDALAEIRGREGKQGEGIANSIRFWLLRLINTREQYMDNQPFTTLSALEEYAERTYSTLMYATLAAIPIRSVHVDHMASHIGKACGIVAILRGVPILAAPPRPVGGRAGLDSASGRNPAVLLPLDVMAAAGLKEEDVFRKGGDAPGLDAAVFEVATRAHDHLLTAGEMHRNLQAGKDAGHEFEHEGDAEHTYARRDPDGGTAAEIQRAFGVLLEHLPAADFLTRLQEAQFNPFKVKRGWKVPWRIWRTLSKGQIQV